MTEITIEDEARSRDFVKAAAKIALHVHAINEAIALKDMDLLEGSVEFGKAYSETILAQIPSDIRMEVLIELIAEAANI